MVIDINGHPSNLDCADGKRRHKRTDSFTYPMPQFVTASVSIISLQWYFVSDAPLISKMWSPSPGNSS